MDIIPIAPLPQQNLQAAPGTDTAQTGASGFDNLLDRQIAKTQKPTAAEQDTSPQNNPTDGKTNSQPAETQDAGPVVQTESETNGLGQAQDTETNDLSNAQDAIGQSQSAERSQAVSFIAQVNSQFFSMKTSEGSSAPNLPSPFIASISQQNQQSATAASPKEFVQLVQFNQAGVSTGQLGQPPEEALTVTVATGQQLPQMQQNSRQASLLVEQLQQLILQNNDKVSVTASFQHQGSKELPGFLNSPVVMTQTDETGGIATALKNQPSVVAGALLDQEIRAKQDLPQVSLRQEEQGALFRPKLSSAYMELQEDSNRDLTRQQNSSLSQNSLASSRLLQQPTVIDQPQTPNSFFGQFQELTQQAGGGIKEAALPPGTQHANYVHENEVINQIIQRFSIQNKLQTSRLSLKLHPAELGELKIDLVVKHDSLKANIYAQSQQVQELIEKHLPRLRTILEEQGMSVEDLIVTFESDLVEDFTKQQNSNFQDQMTDFDRNNLLSRTQTPTLTFEETVSNSAVQPSGLSLTI